ncbi:hypothetical protein CTEN210_12079 [Chaetoceros tenuissimus]|uniref:Methyltransferase FkbM domain-containing protein n=1 Tax=Chaetoceros tenuissimus TaxID=426638 RepID=A0AAD3D0T5_9STRA|nr:hypothetical protein CTEN210_12079 [Chaetoceros tenuissimus]
MKSGIAEDIKKYKKGGVHFDIIQIGAHTGFDYSDPIADGLGKLLLEWGGKKYAEWFFVEPSPSNFYQLEKNLKLYSKICPMKAINTAVVPDNIDPEEKKDLIFYSFKKSIDPITGYDTISGKTFPSWVTQISSFNKETALSPWRVFRRKGLNINDYIVETKVEPKTYTDLMNGILVTKKTKRLNPLLVLIDTEGFDCSIIEGISLQNSFWPKYLIFENHCKYENTLTHLEKVGYEIKGNCDGGNYVAVKN